MDSIRWILLVIALLILLGIYLWGRYKPQINVRKKSEDSLQKRIDPVLNTEVKPVNETETDRNDPDLNPALSGSDQDDQHSLNAADDPEKIVVLKIQGKHGGYLHGGEICMAADKAGLVYGEHKVFHRMHEREEGDASIFLLANMMEPGSIDLDTVQDLQTPGMALFMTLPGPISALDAWDAMLATGQRLAELLDANLMDDAGNSMARQRIAHIREEMRAFDRAQGQ